MNIGDIVRVKNDIMFIDDNHCTMNTVDVAKNYIGRTFTITQNADSANNYFSTEMMPYFHKDWLELVNETEFNFMTL